MARPRTLVVEAAVRPPPYPSLPVRAHGQVTHLARRELEAIDGRTSARLRTNAWVYIFLTLIRDAEGPVVVGASDVGYGRAFHVMDCMGGRVGEEDGGREEGSGFTEGSLAVSSSLTPHVGREESCGRG